MRATLHLACILVVASLHGGQVAAQRRCLLHDGDNKIWMFNTGEPGGLVEYPNFRSPGGNVDGDAFWKVIPSELMLRTSNFCAPTNTTITVNIDNWGPPGPTVLIHRCEVLYARRDANGHLVPDFSRPFIRASLGTEARGIGGPGNYLYRQGSTTGHIDIDPWRELGIAFVLYAPPGQTPTSPNVQRGIHSRNERYGRAPQPSFSGVRNGRTGELSLLVPPLVPQAAEFMFAVGFYDSMVSVSASSSGGGNQAWEMHTGVGAFYNDLASRGGRLRIYVEEDGFAGIRSGRNSFTIAAPVLSLGRPSGRITVPGLTCEMTDSLGNPLAFLPAYWGWIDYYYTRDATTNLADAYYFAPWIDVPQTACLIDVRLHFEVLNIGLVPRDERVVSVSNSLEITLK